MAARRPEPPISLQEIEEVKDLKGARVLAERFSPKVSLKKCSLPKMKERLRLAVKKWNGQMKDIDALGAIMKQRREEDKTNRDKLLDFYISMKAVMAKMEDNMKRHIGMEYQNIDAKIRQFIAQLHDPANKLVVAGETSSGKSTVLNIFLNDGTEEEMLPVKLLSCTATICEIKWSEKHVAKIVTKGVESTVAFNERHKYIYKESERESRFPHDLVRLQMPSPFLKSGAWLIDSPGIGENTEMGNVIKEYVKKNDIFGFVFTVASNRAGGVLNKFLNLLRALSSDDYMDKYGQRKLDPRSCIFVANFWDEVPQQDRETTKAHIFKMLTELPYMRGFDPHKQIFFLDASFAYNSKAAGYISDDFAHFIDGLGKFVWQEQQRKLQTSYHWIENALQRVLHPVRGFIRNMAQTRSLRKRNKGNRTRALDELDRRFRDTVKENRQLFDQRKSNCVATLLRFMQSPEAKTKMAKWRLADMPTEESDDNWVIIEMKLDETIDERVSDLMQDWEKESQCISKAEADLTQTFTYHFEAISTELEVVEREIRSTSSQIEETEANAAPISEVVFQFPNTPDEGREFHIAFGQTHGSDIMGSSDDVNGILGSVSSGPTMKALKNRFYNTPSPLNSEVRYRQNKLTYMEERASRVFEGMCHETYVESVITDQLKPLVNFLDHMDQTITKVIQSNHSLLHQIAEERRNKQAVENLYSPIENQLVQLLDDVLNFRNGFMIEDDFTRGDFLNGGHFKFVSHSLYAGHAFGKICSLAIKERRNTGAPMNVDVTCWRARGFGIPPLRPSDKHSHGKYLRQLSRRSDVATLLGTCTLDNQNILVLEGQLYPAREHLLHDQAGRGGDAAKQIRLNTNIGFLKDLAYALMFLHLKKLVHCEFSLDSVMMKKGAHYMTSPLLCNLSEPTTLTITQHKELPISHYIHIPPEVLHNNREMYTQESDMFGLGIIMLELWYQRDVFAQYKKSMKLGNWLRKEDVGELLIEEAKSQNSKQPLAGKLPKEWKELALKCLHRKPSNRPDIRRWINEWEGQMSMYFSSYPNSPRSSLQCD